MGQIESFSPYKNSVKQLGWQSAGDTLSIPYSQGGFVLLLSRDGEERAAEHMPAAQGFSLDLNRAAIRGETPQNDAGSPCRLPGGAVPLHQALLCPQALQAVPERDLLLQASAGGCRPAPASPGGVPLLFFGAKPSAFCPPQPPPGLRDQQGDLRPHRVCPRRAAAG